MAYESNDARNRSETYKEGGKVTLSKRDKDDLAQAKKRIGQQAKHVVGIPQENYDPGDIDITDITRNVEEVENMKSWMEFREKEKKRKASRFNKDGSFKKPKYKKK